MHPSEPPKSSKITLNSGRIITLHEIYQDLTYSGLLEGFPNKLTNKEIVPNAIKTAKQKLYDVTIPHIVHPAENPINIKLSDWTKKYYEHLGIDGPSEFPRIKCIANFESDCVNNDYCFSYLTIIWFQNDWVLPIDKNIIKKIKAIDWDKKAIDCNY